MSRSLRFALGVTVFIVLFSLAAYPSQASDARTVSVFVDGQEKSVSTRAKAIPKKHVQRFESNRVGLNAKVKCFIDQEKRFKWDIR